jgi:tRNA(Arg) A34 adenosine deaminase TadA
VESLAPVIQGTVELIHQPEDGEGGGIIAVAVRLRRRDRIAMQFVAVHESNDPTRHSVEAWELATVGLTLAS